MLLLLLLLSLSTFTFAKVGFEFELGQFRITYADSTKNSLIPRKAVLYESPSKLWNLTVDQVVSGNNDIEIVTIPFDYYANKNTYLTLSLLRQMSNEIQNFLNSLVSVAKHTLNEISIPDYISKNEYRLQLSFETESVESVAPQVTFGILPTHFYHLVCEQLILKNLDEGYSKYFWTGAIKEFQLKHCLKMDSFFGLDEVKKIPYTNDPSMRSFLTLFQQYLTLKSNIFLPYPKLVSGVFLSRVPFSEMFRDLSFEVRSSILQNDLLYKVAELVRGKGYNRSNEPLFPFGYKDGTTVREGPTLESWIQGFTRTNNPIDLLAKLDPDLSMGQMPMDRVICHNQGCMTLWIFEHRGLSRLHYKSIGEFVQSLTTYISKFNLKVVPGQPNPPFAPHFQVTPQPNHESSLGHQSILFSSE